ncbi:hypothetical protein U1Q18_051151 [Sarracenia purpurea var. burkii]
MIGVLNNNKPAHKLQALSTILSQLVGLAIFVVLKLASVRLDFSTPRNQQINSKHSVPTQSQFIGLAIFVVLKLASGKISRLLAKLEGKEQDNIEDVRSQTDAFVKQNLFWYFIVFGTQSVVLALTSIFSITFADEINDKYSLLMPFWYSCGDHNSNRILQYVCWKTTTEAELLWKNTVQVMITTWVTITFLANFSLYCVMIDELVMLSKRIKEMVNDFAKEAHLIDDIEDAKLQAVRSTMAAGMPSVIVFYIAYYAENPADKLGALLSLQSQLIGLVVFIGIEDAKLQAMAAMPSVIAFSAAYYGQVTSHFNEEFIDQILEIPCTFGSTVGFLNNKNPADKLEALCSVQPQLNCIAIFIVLKLSSSKILNVLAKLEGKQQDNIDNVRSQSDVFVKKKLIWCFIVIGVQGVGFTLSSIFSTILTNGISDQYSLVIPFWFSCGYHNSTEIFQYVCWKTTTKRELFWKNVVQVMTSGSVIIIFLTTFALYGVMVGELVTHFEKIKEKVNDFVKEANVIDEIYRKSKSTTKRKLEIYEEKLYHKFLQIIQYQRFLHTGIETSKYIEGAKLQAMKSTMLAGVGSVIAFIVAYYAQVISHFEKIRMGDFAGRFQLLPDLLSKG